MKFNKYKKLAGLVKLVVVKNAGMGKSGSFVILDESGTFDIHGCGR